MDKLQKLYQIAEAHDIGVYFYDIGEPAAAAVSGDGFSAIALNPRENRSERQELEHLSHELGHIETGTLHSRDADPIEVMRGEYRCTAWVVNYLVPIDELREVHPLSAREAERLASCLNDKDLVAATLVVLDESDFGWCACCDASTVSALCAALYQSTSVHESVILEDAYAHLIHSRLDLSASLRACNPEAYLMRTMYAPIDPRSAAFIDLSEKGNVA